MKKSTRFILFLALSFTVMACQDKTNQVSDNQIGKQENHLEVYKRALELKDYQTAIIALNYMHAEDSAFNQYTDSLIRLYARAGLYNSVIKLGTEFLGIEEGKDTIRELVAVSNNALGNYDEAYRDFELLYNKENDPTYLYNLAKINYSMGKIDEARNKFNTIIKDTSSNSKMVEFPSQSGALQKVPLPAGCYMMLANMEAEKERLQPALNYLKKALQISPAFETAQYSVQQIKQYQAQLQMQKQMQQGTYPGYR